MSEGSKVRLWIWAGFLVVLVLLAVVGAVSYDSFEKTVERFDEASRVSGNTVKVLTADRNIAAFQRHAIDILGDVEAGDNEAVLKRINGLDAEIHQEIAAALRLTQSTELRQGLERLRALVTSFRERFNKGQALRKRKVTMVAEVEAVGQKGRKLLDDFGRLYHAEAEVALPLEALMHARLDVLRFVATPNETFRNRAAEMASDYAKRSEELGGGHPADRLARLSEIAAAAVQFGAAFRDAATVILELDKLTNEVMETISKEIFSVSAAVRKSQETRLEQIDDEVAEYISHTKAVIGTLTIVAAACGLLCALMISRIVSRPIIDMAKAAQVAQEIGELIRFAAQDGDFRNRAATEGRSGFVATISVAINQLFDSICATLRAINQDAGTVAMAASDVSGAVVEVNAGGAEQARSLEQMREAIRQSAASVTRVSDDAKTAAAAAHQATGLVNRGQIVIEGLAELMESVARNARAIAQATAALGQIAVKTDILATTAAVEAARMGDGGRGFAVIGQQIGQLAENSAAFSTRIAELVATAAHDTQIGLAAAGNAKQVMVNISKQVQESDAMIRSIAESMLAQQAAIVEIDATSDSLAQIGEHNVQAGEQIAMRMTQLRDLANATQAAVARYKTD